MMTDKSNDMANDMVFVAALLYPMDDDYNVLAEAEPEPVQVGLSTGDGYTAVCIHEKGPMTYEERRRLQINPDDLKRARLAHANIRPAIINEYTLDIDTDDETGFDDLHLIRKDEHEIHALVHMNQSNKSSALYEREDGRMMRAEWENVRFMDTSERFGLFDWDMPDDATKETQVEQND